MLSAATHPAGVLCFITALRYGCQNQEWLKDHLCAGPISDLNGSGVRVSGSGVHSAAMSERRASSAWLAGTGVILVLRVEQPATHEEQSLPEVL